MRAARAAVRGKRGATADTEPGDTGRQAFLAWCEAQSGGLGRFIAQRSHYRGAGEHGAARSLDPECILGAAGLRVAPNRGNSSGCVAALARHGTAVAR